MSFLQEMFGTEKPMIGLIHLQALPGDPFYRQEMKDAGRPAAAGSGTGGGMDAVIERAEADLKALQSGGIDGVLFTNEFSMPYQKKVSGVTLAAMGTVIGALRRQIEVPFGAEAIFDGDATIELCAAVEADFTRCLFTGVWDSDFGLVDRDIAHTLRLKNSLRLDRLKMFYFVTSEGDASVGGRTPEEIGASLLFNCRPDALVVGGNAAGARPGTSLLQNLREIAGSTPVICGTGCRKENLEEILPLCDGAFIGTSLKRDGRLENPVDAARVGSFMEKVRRLRG